MVARCKESIALLNSLLEGRLPLKGNPHAHWRPLSRPSDHSRMTLRAFTEGFTLKGKPEASAHCGLFCRQPGHWRVDHAA